MPLGAEREHNLRASYAQAYRAPALLDRYIRLDIGRIMLIGNANGGFDWFESSLPEPDTILEELMTMTVPWAQPDFETVWFRNVAKGEMVSRSLPLCPVLCVGACVFQK